ncbi:hypothetical protein DYP60_01660 [Sphaerochaeta halotolerans]|uniref:DUF3575 domain-containing protein n=1 Tax=Sphaerochaeta halotolerans TaxID=2293840 RepID=A0A372MIX9_9SPIR|nr:hypothetical protein [Sphaerochaeta halotolerans]MDN5332827.1 hypothetical protein [Sphaerochaeta sp.]RFU95742.1 hypothetical protein DYP60_01660 [Sphaerochaeta halotolerans]
MRTLMILIPVLIICGPIFGAGHSLFCAVDSTLIDALWEETVLARVEVGLSLDEQFALRLPISLAAEREIGGPRLLESGLFLDYYPLDCGLHLTVSLIQVGFLFNDWYDDKEDPLTFLNEMAFGWTITPYKGLRVEPRVILRDPNGVFSSAYNTLSLRFSRFPMIRFSLLVGWTFPLRKTDQTDIQEEEGT